ncbi:MAG: hypothetical protein UFJ18_11810 [Blautia sp.]|nr:hypothetical protein [Blautia sp.]
MKAIIKLTCYHFKSWRSDYHVLAAFLLGAALCMKNCYGYLSFANGINSSVNVLEPYIIIGSRIPFLMGILLGNLLLLSNAPFVSSVSKYEILRVGYKKWYWSQIIYIFLTCILYSLYILTITGIVALLYSNVDIQNMWSKSMDMIAVKQTDIVIKKYEFSFTFPEFISSVSPLIAAFLTVLFNSVYMVFIGVCIFVINLVSGSSFGWMVAAAIHMFGYIVYANGGFMMPLRYSLLCCCAPVYHYISDLKMPSGYSLCLFFVLIISIVLFGRKFISKSLIVDRDSK